MHALNPAHAAALALTVALPLSAAVPGDVHLDPAFGGVGFSTAVALRHAGDGSDRKFVVERGGIIQLVDAAGNVETTPFLNIASQVSTTGEGGLLGLAFHPAFAGNGRFFVYYTWDNGTGLISRISEFTVSGTDPDVADPSSERVILEVPQDFANHNGGDLHFGPDGFLWIGLGDGGSGNDPCNRAQTLDPAELDTNCGNHPVGDAQALLGKMLRIDVDNATETGENNLCGARQDGSAAYSIPAENPFVVALFRDRFALPPQSLGITDGTCAETWAYGLRNPYRFSFDRNTGDLWIGDVGQNSWEEIDHVPAGNAGGINLGWRICEGSHLRGTSTPCDLTGHFPPVFEYARVSPHCSVTGGFRYRGPVLSLQGRYVFGDFCSGTVWFAEETAPDDWEVLEFGNSGGNIYGFGEDEAGELYLLRGGNILRFDGDR
ncbi:PQQ-dependent sugar dehydrogenase [Wenzhouxiangella sp. XN201]|uniref:PQQ-dependent sugar dehydrogenase n=1 Tax=Wenzhouxiangella sp. XN201 TaxID=2710755 RepID=UPI0013CAA348|nr:PQQ-dependent sugar dehydrogenase [Wenzhouxiangella sp. XN201]NEZ02630.1 PQQ-dependent sugar dehydrogenase [Wenzhouxiangella sp. XN201]